MGISQKTVLSGFIILVAVVFNFCLASVNPLYDCRTSKYGCCPDGVTDAFGWNKKKCSEMLCYDKDKNCQKWEKEGACKNLHRWASMSDLCPKTCGRCGQGKKFASPPACYQSKYGCCYDGVTPAISDDKRPGVGCPFCRDLWPHTCKQFGGPIYCKGKWPHTRFFLKNHCFKQCGICKNFHPIEKRAELKNWRNSFY